MLPRGEDVIAGQIARLFFRCFSSSGAVLSDLRLLIDQIHAKVHE